MRENVLKTKSFDFAIRIVNLCRFLENEKGGKAIGNQLLRAGTAIGALINEAEFSQSRADFISKLSISLKECNETIYWIRLLLATDYIPTSLSDSFLNDCEELKAMLISSIRTAKQSIQ